MKILAAGRTSTERAALSIARELGLDSGGRCLKGQDYRETITRSATEAQATISLTRSRHPQMRTLRPIFNAPSLAFGFAILRDKKAIADIREWFRRDRVEVVHVTGHVPYSEAKEFLREVLKNETGG